MAPSVRAESGCSGTDGHVGHACRRRWRKGEPMIRTAATIVLSVAILAGAYIFAFGLPVSVASLIGGPVGTEDSAGADATGPGKGGRSGNVPPGGRRGGTATTVVTAPLEMRPYVSVLSAIGSAQAHRSVSVSSTAAGEVIETNLSANRQVEAGDVLVRIDSRTENLDLQIAEAELAQAKATVSRYESLQATGNSTVTNVALSDARLAQQLAEAAVGLAQVALDDRTIRAPISGTLGLSSIEVGDTLATDTAIATIDDAEVLIVEFEVPERAIGLLADVEDVLASTPTFTGRVFDGKITSFDSRIDSVTRSVTVEARIENPDGLLWPGMTFAVRLEHESAPLRAVPSTAVTWSRTGSAVWADMDGTAERIPVTILFRRNDTVWIDGEIAEGTSVVTEGAQKLRPGARIVAPDAGPPEDDRQKTTAGSAPQGQRVLVSDESSK